tara:strand:- start:356 stop:1093 length:738 start_codon:yes stop_codon:yes gene_type:complete
MKVPEGFNSIEEFYYSLHISEDNQYILLNNPKCGCSTTKATLNTWEAESRGLELKYKSLSQVHDRTYNFLKSPNQIELSVEQLLSKNSCYKKIAIVRKPESRLLSAYSSKLTWNSDELKKYLALCQSKGMQFHSCFPTFTEFVESLEDTEILYSNEHWRPQYLQICYEVLNFDFIGKFEDLENSLIKFGQKVYPTKEEFQVVDARTINAENATVKSPDLKRELIENIPKIENIFDKDYFYFYRKS